MYAEINMIVKNAREAADFYEKLGFEFINIHHGCMLFALSWTRDSHSCVHLDDFCLVCLHHLAG